MRRDRNKNRKERNGIVRKKDRKERKKGKQQEEQFGNICIHMHWKEVTDAESLTSGDEGKERELYLAAVLPVDGSLLLTMLIKLYSSTNKAKGLNMEMSDGGRMARIVGYDLYFILDCSPGLRESSSRLRIKAGARSKEMTTYETKDSVSSLIIWYP